MRGFSSRPSILEGVDIASLQRRLSTMQQAYLELSTGQKIQVASYAQGDGTRTVTYTQANIADLTQAIITVQKQIDVLNGQCINRRAPIRPVF